MKNWQIIKERLERSPWISLAFVAALSGLLWRFEVECHGWSGLIWLGYFHVAIPAGFALFLVWANVFIEVRGSKRFILNSAALIYGVVIYNLLEIALTYIFATGLLGMMLWMGTPAWQPYVLASSVFVIIPFIPFGAYLILRLSGKKVRGAFVILSIAGMIVSVPMAVLFLKIGHHKGGADVLHALKSGYLIPFWVFSAGLLIVGQKKYGWKEPV